MDRYPIAREKIVKHFKSVNKFCEKTKIPKTSVVRVLQGKYGSGETDDSAQRKRIEQAMRAEGVPGEDMRNLWARITNKGSTSIVNVRGRKFKITTVTLIEDLGGSDAI